MFKIGKDDDTQTDKSCYTKYGFSGLSVIGKVAFIAIALGVGGLVWLVWAKGDFAAPSGEAAGFLDSFRSWLLGAAKIIGFAMAAAYGGHFFLPKQKFYRQQFFCAECGQLLGFAIVQCPNMQCGSNRYTTDSQIAKRRAFLWQKANRTESP